MYILFSTTQFESKGPVSSASSRVYNITVGALISVRELGDRCTAIEKSLRVRVRVRVRVGVGVIYWSHICHSRRFKPAFHKSLTPAAVNL